MTGFNLVIVHAPGEQNIGDWRAVASLIEQSAPDIEVRVADNNSRNLILMYWQASRPSLVFSASLLRKFRPRGGTVYAGKILSKWEEVMRFREAGVSTPLTALWGRDDVYPTETWGEQVIAKPIRGLKGSGIQLIPTADVRELWGSTTHDGDRPFMLQKFVDTGLRPNQSRVLTGFGLPLYMVRRWAGRASGDQPRAPGDPQWRLVTNSSEDLQIETDEAILTFARQIAGALPEVPVLGCDIVQDAQSGALYALEANSFGQTWHFSSDTHNALRQRIRRPLDYYSQFGALNLLADELIRRVRAEAK
jgi:hypothetical protein